MNNNEAIIAQTIEQLERMNRVLEHLRKEVLLEVCCSSNVQMAWHG